MNASDLSKTDVPFISILVTLPPPTTGMTVVTERVVEVLEQRFEVKLFDWSPGVRRSWLWWRTKKFLRVMFSVVMLVRWRSQGGRILYTVANSGHGLYYNLLIASVAKILGYRCVLHHHVFSYLLIRDYRMLLLSRILGRSGVNVFLAPEMKTEFEERYGTRNSNSLLSNVFVLSENRSAVSLPKKMAGTWKLGHLSNLTFEKGLKLVLESFNELVSRGNDVQLVLAGPITGDGEQAVIQAAVERHGERIDYRGPIYGDEKASFFREINVFLFPSRYRNEAQPVVIAEALSHACPVIAFERGCISSMIRPDGGVVVPADDDFVTATTTVVESWINEPCLYDQSVGRARRQMEYLHNQAGDELESFQECFLKLAAGIVKVN